MLYIRRCNPSARAGYRNKGRKVTARNRWFSKSPRRRQDDATRFLPRYTYRYALAGYSGISSPGRIDLLSLLLPCKSVASRRITDFPSSSLFSLSSSLSRRTLSLHARTNKASRRQMTRERDQRKSDTKHPLSTLPGVGGDVT